MADKETHTLWDHISGEAFKGPLKGYMLETWPVVVTSVSTERSKYPETHLFISTHRSLLMYFNQFILSFMGIRKRGFIPPNFYLSMSKPIDPRLPKLTLGLGVVVGKKAKYYPVDNIPSSESIRDIWGNRIIIIDRTGIDGIPQAIWEDTGKMPMQLLSRWYGFSFTYPNCEIFKYADHFNK